MDSKNFTVSLMVDPTYLANPPACGAPPGWLYGYLPGGCRNDGYGHHVARHFCYQRGEVWGGR